MVGYSKGFKILWLGRLRQLQEVYILLAYLPLSYVAKISNFFMDYPWNPQKFEPHENYQPIQYNTIDIHLINYSLAW